MTTIKNKEWLIGKTIGAFFYDNEKMVIIFDNGESYKITDNAKYCCETRWLTCDDDLGQFIDEAIVDLELLEGPDLPKEDLGDDEHNTMFLRIVTTGGCFRLTMHNQHNGYYSGFDPVIERA